MLDLTYWTISIRIWRNSGRIQSQQPLLEYCSINGITVRSSLHPIHWWLPTIRYVWIWLWRLHGDLLGLPLMTDDLLGYSSLIPNTKQESVTSAWNCSSDSTSVYTRHPVPEVISRIFNDVRTLYSNPESRLSEALYDFPLAMKWGWRLLEFWRGSLFYLLFEQEHKDIFNVDMLPRLCRCNPIY